MSRPQGSQGRQHRPGSLLDRVEPAGGQIVGIKQAGDEAHGEGAGLQVRCGVGFIDAAGGNDPQEGHRAEAGLDVGRADPRGREELL